ncbi:hypothetical protein CcaverHIS002_0308010 [Cutaneotrichosporon cavernicola]|uniref:Ubiquitin-like modifier-activating enzyme ATG7 n=1 Tax=Cutaneotrichosporon cavernicola TaxID=279322 RepID=A0AA48I6Q1_9TREE|nr:uncharacterized protein CcaverHIS019_0307890 [Cutaneotrichosporon cavernicola]BEI82933.1 hypothetical protein CcaverHIS002_0308010 [Cutaneotrichosporon cavernicola]BEI90719.1 hypothetical protein CcaverHIS019_0307890 [Cutaneotrichosporon cavernicola]BEI98499.1 hypothetical protein CcaverHIS631_0307980 [Cutaneotrichosporon cavernicola]
MTTLQFQPLQSQPTPEFWASLTALKLDKLGLDDSVLPIHAIVDEGRQISTPGSHHQTKNAQDHSLQHYVHGGVLLSATAFEELNVTTANQHSMVFKGEFKNFNTLEEFRSPQAKKALFDSMVARMIESFTTDQPILNSFLMFAFADLKKYSYHYRFAFPALVSKPAWLVEGGFRQAERMDVDEVRALVAHDSDFSVKNLDAFIVKGTPGQRQLAPITQAKAFFDGIPDKERMVVFHDPSALPNNPGWPLRNALYFLQVHQGISAVNVLCLRQGEASLVGSVSTADSGDPHAKPQAVGWERDHNGALASKRADLGASLDPARLAEQAVDLNLKLMRWRIMPELDLDKVASTRCLLLGAGTLGCYVARALMGWGIRTITFVDSARVSFSNPVRQPLFRFEDCLDGGKPKAACAAGRLREIFPSMNAIGHSFTIPMPGHPVGDRETAHDAKDSVELLERLISEHDVVFLLMDSRESRWLPTLIAASQGKLVINAALGFDSYLVMRHGVGAFESHSKRLGCYFCNDIVAPVDSLTDRTLDQMCTVTRPGIAPIAAASAVELLAAVIQHPLGRGAPAERPGNVISETQPGSPLGPVPHQLRGALRQWNTSIVEGYAFERCTACSEKVSSSETMC